MKTAGTLNDRSKKELADLAKRNGVRGWEAMDKPSLIKALAKKSAPKSSSSVPDKSPPKSAKPPVKVAKVAAKVTKAKKVKPTPKPADKGKVVAKAAPTPKPAPAKTKPTPTVASPVTKATTNGSHKPVPPAVTKPLIQKTTTPAKTATKSLLPTRDTSKEAARSLNTATKDRIFLTVPNPYWLNAYWELTTHSMQRAEAALRQDWHGAKLIIRLFDVTSGDTTSTSETPVKDVTIQGTGQTWYIDVSGVGRAYRADIGYVSRRGDFYVLARSNVVTPPKAGTGEAGEGFDLGGWDDDDAKRKAERILAMSTGFESSGSSELRELYEERLGRPLGPPKQTAFGTGAIPPGSVKKFFFEIDAKLIVFGRTDPSAHLTLNNDPIKLSSDGTFRMTFNLPDSRQIIPAVAASADGVEERTIVLAVERNTKHLDPMIHDQMNEV
ncbi:hypothetical protein GobsT_19700 [Gemmata obscuriglobus]|nr:hypothetical protein GobsT_19700 [Gemmata obscuriglobus]VTS03945.1 Uncharacterized protein OS=Singulisphaera acidiphila (strain ATCC BAA-1392 / DSM 18658 / VKM B-2454 / MOB10) GN=Sinac_6872 PE=4 SV=1 [Gemmata obscuriglobus UQM 2246]